MNICESKLFVSNKCEKFFLHSIILASSVCTFRGLFRSSVFFSNNRRLELIRTVTVFPDYELFQKNVWRGSFFFWEGIGGWGAVRGNSSSYLSVTAIYLFEGWSVTGGDGFAIIDRRYWTEVNACLSTWARDEDVDFGWRAKAFSANFPRDVPSDASTCIELMHHPTLGWGILGKRSEWHPREGRRPPQSLWVSHVIDGGTLIFIYLSFILPRNRWQ